MQRTAEEAIVVEGSREHWFEICHQLLNKLAKPDQITADQRLWQLEAKWWVLGIPTYDAKLLLTLLPSTTGHSEIRIKATSDTGLEWHLFFSPHNTVLAKFKQLLRTV